jgi:hypothetical protein
MGEVIDIKSKTDFVELDKYMDTIRQSRDKGELKMVGIVWQDEGGTIKTRYYGPDSLHAQISLFEIGKLALWREWNCCE